MERQPDTNDPHANEPEHALEPAGAAASTPLAEVAKETYDHDQHAQQMNGEDIPERMPTEGTPLPEFWAALKRMPRYVRLSANLARDKHVPRRAKLALMAGGAYAVSPIDLVPGVIPVAGQLDDLFVMMTAVQHAVNALPPEVAADHLDRARLTRKELDADMDAVRATIGWLVKRGAKAGGRVAGAGLRKVQALLRSRR